MSEATTDANKTNAAAGEAQNIGQQLGGKYMTFKLASEEYGLAILRVREIIGLMDITRVPRTKEFIRGVINLRGKVIPVVDLRLKFNMPGIESTDQTVIIVVQWLVNNSGTTMGILVDEVLEVMNIAGDQIEPPPELYSRDGETDFILGIGKADKRVICLLDIERVLSRDETIHVRHLEESYAQEQA